MTLEQTAPIVASIVGGGAAGAIITQLVAVYRNRKQPVGYRYESSKLFAPPSGNAAPRFLVTFTPPIGPATELTNVHTVRLEIINRGNQDKPKMALGVTIPPGQGIVHVEKTTGDRHHHLTIESNLRPEAPSHEIDVVLEPFNRGDLYTLTLYVTLPPQTNEAGPVSLSSAEAVRFVQIPSPTEIAIDLVEGLSLPVGPVRIAIGLR